MHIKFINQGTGSAKSAEIYLLQSHDYKGKVRVDVKILRGNPSQVTRLADALSFKYRYRSAVIAWHKDDAPSDRQIEEVLDDFEKLAFSGLEGNQYSYYAVLHKDSNGANHIHLITPRVELSTGKSLNIAPPNWQKSYDLLRDMYNAKYNWASPKDISRHKGTTIDQLENYANTSLIEAKKKINNFINQSVVSGRIKNSDDIQKQLSGLGVITRRGKDYISIKLNGHKKAIRLKGIYYGQEFDIRRARQELRENRSRGVEETNRDRVYFRQLLW